VLVERAITDERGLAARVALTDEAFEHLLRLAGGDARRALTALEAAAGAAEELDRPEIDLELLERAVDRAAVRYDRDGDQHYDVTSAFIKSIRGGDVDAALHYLARMIEAGEDPRFIARRLVILASEDVGLADPQALVVAVAAAQALDMVGLPEARLNLAEATIYLSLAPKSNAVIRAIEAAVSDVREGLAGAVPRHLRDTHYPGARRLRHGQGYRYPHDFPGGVVQQQYAPDPVTGRDYYRPSDRGAERAAAQRLAALREVLRGAAAEGGPEDEEQQR
jgi:putative ATPase